VLIIGNTGRPWSIQELRERSWEDLHGLWHVCVRERNRIMTSDMERIRLKPGYGEYESGQRDAAVSFALAFTITLPCSLGELETIAIHSHVYTFDWLSSTNIHGCTTLTDNLVSLDSEHHEEHETCPA
jgi:hypothetical protein